MTTASRSRHDRLRADDAGDLLSEGTADWLAAYDAVLRPGEPVRFERALALLGLVLDRSAYYRLAAGSPLATRRAG